MSAASCGGSSPGRGDDIDEEVEEMFFDFFPSSSSKLPLGRESREYSQDEIINCFIIPHRQDREANFFSKTRFQTKNLKKKSK